MSKPSATTAELFNLGFRREGGDGWYYLRADWGDGMFATLDVNGAGTYKCMITHPAAGRQGRVSCGRSKDPLEAVREAVRLAGMAYVEAVRVLEDRNRAMKARLSTLVSVKEKMDLNVKKENKGNG